MVFETNFISKIVEVDDGLLRFKNLKELTLSANKIEKIDPRSLPNQLEVSIKMIISLSEMKEIFPKYRATICMEII